MTFDDKTRKASNKEDRFVFYFSYITIEYFLNKRLFNGNNFYIK